MAGRQTNWGRCGHVFLKGAVEHHRQAIRCARSTVIAEQASLSNWAGNPPYLRLIHCVVDDSVKEHYRRRDTIHPGRIVVDNRNSCVREEYVWEKISNLWNDREFNNSLFLLRNRHRSDDCKPKQLSETILFWMSRNIKVSQCHHNHIYSDTQATPINVVLLQSPMASITWN